MTNEQYLDAISCPRVAPITQGRKVRRSRKKVNNSSIALSDELDNCNDGDGEGDSEVNATEASAKDVPSESEASEIESTRATLPEGAFKPDDETERAIEQVCRIVSMVPAPAATKLEDLFRQRYKETLKYSFLDSREDLYPYFKWRLDLNRAGYGIPPGLDYGSGNA